MAAMAVYCTANAGECSASVATRAGLANNQCKRTSPTRPVEYPSVVLAGQVLQGRLELAERVAVALLARRGDAFFVDAARVGEAVHRGQQVAVHEVGSHVLGPARLELGEGRVRLLALAGVLVLHGKPVPGKRVVGLLLHDVLDDVYTRHGLTV